MNLNEYVKQVSLEDFGWEFRHQAFWNKRLRTTGGRFLKSMKLLGWRPSEKLSAMSWLTIISIIRVRGIVIKIEILKNCLSR